MKEDAVNLSPMINCADCTQDNTYKHVSTHSYTEHLESHLGLKKHLYTLTGSLNLIMPYVYATVSEFICEPFLLYLEETVSPWSLLLPVALIIFPLSLRSLSLKWRSLMKTSYVGLSTPMSHTLSVLFSCRSLC